MKKLHKLLLAAAIVTLTLCALILPASALRMDDANFPDVSKSDWYYEDLNLLYKFEIIQGSNDGLFHPDDSLKRSEFIKMLATYEGLYTQTADKGIHWSEVYWNILNESGVLETQGMSNGQIVVKPLFNLSFSALEQPVTRYEMSMLINNMLYSVYCENTVKLANADKVIADYTTLDPNYRNPVEQVYGKGIIAGYTDGSFQGNNQLRRCEAVAVIARLFWGSKRLEVKNVEEVIPAEPAPSDFESFAFRYRNMSVEQRRIELFGDPNKTHFTSPGDAANHIVEVTVPIWKMRSNGEKYASTAYLQVHYLVADEIRLIFDEIFNDPERFPINAIGGARYTDALRHSWGCAIDINPNENYYLHYASGQKTGTCCWENAHLYPNIDSRYCITPDSSVVRAFAKYGWGWGGQGWSSGADYMHFSILASGG